MATRMAGIHHAVLTALFFTASISMAGAQTLEWTAPEPLNSYHADDVPSNDIFPSVATDGAGNWVSFWGSQQGLFSARSTDGGATWGPSDQIFSSAATAAGIVYTGEKYVAHWHTSYDFDFITYYTAYRATSSDGITWSEPETVGPVRIDDIDTDGAGTVIVAGTVNPAYSNPGAEYVLQSPHHGESWTSTTMTTLPPGVPRGYVVSLGNSKWAHVLTNYNSNPGSTYWYDSTDNGITWSAPRDISTTIGTVRDLEAYGGVVVAAGSPNIMMSTDSGLNWQVTGSTALGYQQLSVDSSGNWLLTMLEYQGQFGFPIGGETVIIARSSNLAAGWSDFEVVYEVPGHPTDRPMAAGTGNGNFLLAFQSRHPDASLLGPDYDIQAIRSTDAGVSWSSAVYVNDYYADDFSNIQDHEPQVVSGDDGTVVAAWKANTDGSPYLGNDHVIFARSADNGATWSNSAPATPPYGTYNVDFENFELLYAGQGRWMIWWSPGASNYFGDYVISDDNGFTWSAAQTFFGHVAAASGTGTMMKAHVAQKSPPVSGLARLGAGATAWEEPQLIEGAAFTDIVHTGDNNWFAVTEVGEQYVSTDDGRTWSKDNAVGMPGVIFASNHAGTAMAVSSNDDAISADIYVLTSNDNGSTWTDAVLVETVAFISGSPSVTNMGASDWMISWTRNEVFEFGSVPKLEIIISRDNGVTWSAPQQVVPDLNQFEIAGINAIAGQNNKAVAVWGGAGEDVYYSFGNLSPQTAARDWQLFE